MAFKPIHYYRSSTSIVRRRTKITKATITQMIARSNHGLLAGEVGTGAGRGRVSSCVDAGGEFGTAELVLGVDTDVDLWTDCNAESEAGG